MDGDAPPSRPSDEKRDGHPPRFKPQVVRGETAVARLWRKLNRLIESVWAFLILLYPFLLPVEYNHLSF